MPHYEDLIIPQGTDWSAELHLVEEDGSKKDLTGHSVNGKIKKNYNSDSADTFSFISIVAGNPQNGIVNISLTNTTTDTLNYKKRYVYDVELSFIDSDGNTIIERVLEGKVNVTPSVTR